MNNLDSHNIFYREAIINHFEYFSAMRIAILDFGTNTFNLLIADDEEDSRLNYLYSSKEPVKLGKGGISNRILQPDAIERALIAINNHFITIRKYGAEKVYAYATSAIRDAKNSRDFLNQVHKQFDLYVNIIPGEREAELIYKGVRQACNFDEERALILDIGGGSNEIIIADKDKIFWQESYDLGMARLLEKFKPEDPISNDKINEVEAFLDKKLKAVFMAIKKYKPRFLVGAAGSFETFYAICKNKLPDKYRDSEDTPRKKIFLEDYRGLHEQLIKSTLEERKRMPGMEPVRIEMIVLATIFVNFILKKWNFEKLMLSEFSLKEGIIAEILNI